MKYEFLNKDEVLATFEIKDNAPNEILNLKIIKTLPWWIKDLNDWLVNRSAAKHRQYVAKLLSRFNALNLYGFIQLTNCLSIQDTLWVRTLQSDLTWNKVNLFDNEFSSVMSHLAFDGVGLYGEQVTTTSPELTTDGSFNKCWIKRSDGLYLVKAGSSGARNAGLEPYCEVLASQIYKHMCTNAVTYNLELFHGRVVSTCLCFSNETEGYKPFSIFNNEFVKLDDFFEFMSHSKSEEKFREMLVADAITLNTDRHTGNFGFLVDNTTYKVTKMAPVFDYNLSMVPYAEYDIDFQRFDSYILERGPKIGDTYVNTAKRALTSEIRGKLISLKDVELTLPDWAYEPRHYTWEHKRTEYLNEIKDVMIDRVLGKEASFSFVDVQVGFTAPEREIIDEIVQEAYEVQKDVFGTKNAFIRSFALSVSPSTAEEYNLKDDVEKAFYALWLLDFIKL